MTVRELPPEEWGRLPDDARAFFETLNPEDVAVVVVEQAGEIVARMGVLRVPFFESFWMAPEAAGNPGITRALLRAATAKAATWADCWITAHAESDAMRQTLGRLGGQRLPVDVYMLPLQRVEMEEVCRQP